VAPGAVAASIDAASVIASGAATRRPVRPFSDRWGRNLSSFADTNTVRKVGRDGFAIGLIGGGGPVATDPDGTFTGTLGDSDFVAPVKATINTTSPIWWVDSPLGTAGTREKTDMILYARGDLGTVQPFVECGSCHDPHNDTTQGQGSVAFLRINNTASQICTTCHVK